MICFGIPSYIHDIEMGSRIEMRMSTSLIIVIQYNTSAVVLVWHSSGLVSSYWLAIEFKSLAHLTFTISKENRFVKCMT